MNPYDILPYLALIAVVLLIILWFTPVQNSTLVVTYWLGEFYRVLRPGPHLVKYPLETSEVISTATRQMELPDEEPNIDRESENPPAGKTKPIRITHKGFREALFYVKKDWYPNSDEEPFFLEATSLEQVKTVRFHQLPEEIKEAIQIDPVNAPLTAEYAAVMEWSIKGEKEEQGASVRDFVSNVSTAEGRTRDEEVRKRATDLVESVLQEYLSQVTHGHAKLMQRLFSVLIHEELEILVGEEPKRDGGVIDKPWGIHVGTAFIKRPYPGHTVAQAQADAAASVSRAQDTIRDSEAKAQATRNQGAAERDKEIDKGHGEAGRLAAMVKVVEENPVALALAQLDVAEQVLPHAKPIIVSGGGGINEMIAGVLALGQQDLRNDKTTAKPVAKEDSSSATR